MCISFVTNLSGIPRGTGIVKYPGRDLALGTASRDDDADLPFPIFDQGLNGMSQIHLMRASGQAMQDHEHGTGVVRAHVRELLFAKIRRPRRQGLIGVRGGLRHEVHGEGPVELGVVGLEYAPLVVDGRAVSLGRRPYRLQVPVEEQRVEIARRHRVPAYLEEARRLALHVL